MVGGRIKPIWLSKKPMWLGKSLYHIIAINESINLIFGCNFAVKRGLFKRLLLRRS